MPAPSPSPWAAAPGLDWPPPPPWHFICCWKAGAARRNGRIILTLAVFPTAATLIWHPEPLPLQARTSTDAADIIGLFTDLGFLPEDAESSVQMQDYGQLLVLQSSGAALSSA
uniref:Uncharacterized protein n=1 Tax=Magnetospirillum gryphiswaldense TaxID=55518 RepID=A4TTW6_9PROT|nr:hypothetical protein MGR_1128 [Magnetospirillum gryphiswaldense MSR-1]